MSEEKPLVDDLAWVLASTVVGWEPIIGADLAEAPQVKRVLARYRQERDLLANGQRVKWCEEHKDVKWKDSPGCHMRRTQNFPNECRIVSKLLIDSITEEER